MSVFEGGGGGGREVMGFTVTLPPEVSELRIEEGGSFQVGWSKSSCI